MPATVITFLKRQHDSVSRLLVALAATTPRAIKTRRQLLAKLETELYQHMLLEEKIFYPSFKLAVERTNNQCLHRVAQDEHSAIKRLLKILEAADPASPGFGDKVKALKQAVEVHIAQEEAEMFPLARELLATVELKELKHSMESGQQQLEAHRAWSEDAIVAAHD